MKLFIKKIKDIKLLEHPWFLAITLNIAYLVGMFIIYKPFLSNDDFLMSETVYGVFGDDYDYHAKYMNFNYGRLIVFFLRLFPNIPWYTILFYIWVFLSLVIVSKIVLEKFPKDISLLAVNVILLYFSYEGYISIQFTKVAGITGAAGAMAILLASSCMEFLAGVILFIISIFVRYDMAKMVVGSMIVMLVLSFGIKVFTNGKIQWKKQLYLRFLCVVLLFMIVPKIPAYDSSEKDYWNYFWMCNSNRSFIQDYELPDYDENQAIYERLNISRNDIYIWKSWNTDGYAMTFERVDVLRKVNSGEITSVDQLQNREYQDEDVLGYYYENYLKPYDSNDNNNSYESTDDSVMNTKMQNMGLGLNKDIIKEVSNYIAWDKMSDFLKKFPRAFLNIDTAFAYLLVCILMIIGGNRYSNHKAFLSVIVSFMIGMLLNYYMYVNDRYLQHRVDVGVFFTIICICIILNEQTIETKKIEKKRNAVITVAVLTLLIIITPYRYWGEDRPIYGEDYLINKQKLIDELNTDNEKSFVFTGNWCQGTLWHQFYDAFTVPQIGCMENCFMGYNVGNVEQYKKQGIDYIFSDIVDNDNICLVLDETDNNESAWEEYISKHSQQMVHLELQENAFGVKIYSVETN